MPRDKQKASSRMDMTMLTLVILLTVFGLVILLSASEWIYICELRNEIAHDYLLLGDCWRKSKCF